jgi:hypothetical protein
MFASEIPSELWARSIAALERDRAEAKEARRVARETEHKRRVLSRAQCAYSCAHHAALAGKPADVERARLIYEAAKVLCRPARPPVVKQPTKLEKLKVAIVVMLRADDGRLEAPAPCSSACPRGTAATIGHRARRLHHGRERLKDGVALRAAVNPPALKI